MKKGLYCVLIGVCCFILFGCFLFSSYVVLADNTNETMVVEANIIGFANESANVTEVSIEVPDYIFLGDVTPGDPVSEEVGIYINNTGKVNVRISPELKDSDEEIFKYLYFRKQQSTSTNNTDLVTFKKIGDYYLDISKPQAGKRYRSGHCYMQLNLTDFDGDIKEDLVGHKADIVFLAMPQ